jgi:hypothetical protein
VTVTLTVETTHPAPGLGTGTDQRITVWQESREIANGQDSTRRGGEVLFNRTFTETVSTARGRVATPTDYFCVRVEVYEAGISSGPSHIIERDPAFLMERQEIAPLPRTGRASDKAGPQELVIYYCDMVPFQRDQNDPASWLARDGVPAYVESELLPAMVEAVRLQTEEWGFAWSGAWTGYRSGPDERRLSVALSADKVWYHGQAPLDGQAAITIRVEGGPNAAYETLTDGIMSTFHHELFHNLQRSIVQEVGGHGEVAGRDDAWEFFSEGTAVLASSVAQPAVQFSESAEPRAYLYRAKAFVGGSGFPGDLNTSYGQMIPYHAAVYWRFLFEQCGGLQETRTGMGLIRRALELFYSNEIVDIAPDSAESTTDLVDWLPAIMDATLSSPEAAACPFQTYEDSLQHFSRALYTLRLHGGRCTAPGEPAGCGLFDPENQYNAPPVSKLTFRGRQVVLSADEQPYPAGIRSSYGMDLIEVILHEEADGLPLTIEFQGEPGAEARFSVQLVKLVDDGTGTSWQPSLTAVGPAQPLMQTTGDERLFYTISEIDTQTSNRLGLIITRLDSQEEADPVGAYTILLRSTQSRHRGRILRLQRAAGGRSASQMQDRTTV